MPKSAGSRGNPGSIGSNPTEAAINQTFSSVAEARAASRKRKKWGYARADLLELDTALADVEGLEAKVRKLFGRAEDAVVRQGNDSLGNVLLAVWLGKPDDIIDIEPEFGGDADAPRAVPDGFLPDGSLPNGMKPPKLFSNDDDSDD